MSALPYRTFEEWELDMNRVRMHPEDSHLIQHVRNRYQASPAAVQAKIEDYLMDVQMETDPVSVGRRLAAKTGKILFIWHANDPWFRA